jgi:carboxyl-terminal processing protease
LSTRSLRYVSLPVFLFAWLLLANSPIRAETETPSLQKAAALEGDGKYVLACQAYDEIARRDRTATEAREGYLRCLRHVHQERRHQDESFRTKLLGLKRPSDALDVYEKVIVALRDNYLDKERVDVASLFQQGLAEFRFAFSDIVFRKQYLADIPQDDIDSFLNQLSKWIDAKVESETDARDKVQEVALAATILKLKPAVVIFEFTWGACNALDEYTTCLTPRQWNDLHGSTKGSYFGIGVRLGVSAQNQLVIAKVFADSPAYNLLKPFDRILEINGHDLSKFEFPKDLPAVGEWLKGDEGSSVELKVESPPGAMMMMGMVGPRVVKVQRGRVPVRSVEDPLLLPPAGPKDPTAVGYVRVNSFSDTTVQDLKSAILRLESSGIDALILDLRNNPGGSFPAGVKVAELFMTEGVIAYKQGRDKEESHKALNPNAFAMPVVVLVDGDTASAAEVVAGALKENNRARLIGETTFGKGSIQKLVQFDNKVPGGMRITVAHFLSPSNRPYHGQGVIPHRVIEQSEAGGDTQLQAAEEEARALANAMRNMKMKMMQ